MRQYVFFILLLVASIQAEGETIQGSVINSLTGEPLEYVNIGIVGFPVGTVTNASGNFTLNVTNQSPESIVRISMIGFKPVSFTIRELADRSAQIELTEEAYELEAVIISPKGKIRDVGVKNRALLKVCGWGGTQRGKGHEIGLKIDLGESPVKLKSLHLRLHSQSFDSSLFRLHIRTINNNIPDKELLKENIFIGVSEEKGWVEIDLSKYEIILNGEIALSLEWLNVFGLNNDKLSRVNKGKKPTANVLFCVSNKKGWVFTRWGSEAEWKAHISNSPNFYLTVNE